MKKIIEKYQDDRYFEAGLILTVVIPHIILAVSNIHAVLNWFLTDDAFYYFQVARNVAGGLGFTFDGINPSNGFHPLWMLICIPVFALAQIDFVLPLRALVVILGLLNAGAAVFLFRLLKRYILKDIARWVAVSWAFFPTLHNLTTKNGLETGVNAFFLLFFWERLTALIDQEELGKDGLRKMFGLGALGLLTILARLDNVYLALVASIWLWLTWWNPPDTGSPPTIKESWLWRIKTGAAFNGIIVAVMSLYLAWNKLAFGTYMPVSGQVKLWWGNLPDSVYGYRVYDLKTLMAELLSPDLKVSPWGLVIERLYQAARTVLPGRPSSLSNSLVAQTAWQIGAGTAVLLLVLIWLNRDYFFERVAKLGLGPFFLGTLIQAAYYKRFGSVPQKAWYWIGQAAFIVICLALALALLHRSLSRLKWPWLAQGLALVMIAGTFIYPISFFRYMQGEVRNGRLQEVHDYLHRREFLAETFEPGTMIGITGSGSWGYFAPDGITVFNMDGLINSLEYLEYMEQGRGAEFLYKSGVDFVLGNPYIIENTQPYGPMLEGHLELYTKYFPPYGSRKFVWSFLP
jgi:hypothetical protein